MFVPELTQFLFIMIHITVFCGVGWKLFYGLPAFAKSCNYFCTQTCIAIFHADTRKGRNADTFVFFPTLTQFVFIMIHITVFYGVGVGISLRPTGRFQGLQLFLAPKHVLWKISTPTSEKVNIQTKDSCSMSWRHTVLLWRQLYYCNSPEEGVMPKTFGK